MTIVENMIYLSNCLADNVVIIFIHLADALNSLSQIQKYSQWMPGLYES